VRTRTNFTILGFCAVLLIPCSALPLETQTAAATTTATTATPHAVAAKASRKGKAQSDATSAPGVYSAASNGQTTTNRDTIRLLSIAIGKSAVVDTERPVKRISVGLGDYAEATAVSPTEVLVNGKSVGETSLILWDVTGARQFIHVTITADTAVADDHLEAVRRELHTELPDEDLKVSTGNGNIFLRGTVKDLNSSERAVAIASTAGKVVNLLYVLVPSGDPQILLKVRFASVDRSLEKQLGINVFTTGFGNVAGSVSTGQFGSTSVSSTNTGASVGQSSASSNIVGFLPGLNVGASIDAMESKGLVQVLSQPNLLAANGKKASFLAGGEYPYPVVQGTASGSAAVTIMFKEYGVRLDFIPTITPRGTVHLQLFSEVSSLDFTNAVEVSGFDVPAIDTRNVKTEVELGDGQSFAVGGLLDKRDTETFQKIPFLGDIPVLGKFFQSISKTKTDTELIVIVTPEIVAPIPAGTPLPALKYPGKFIPPNSDIPTYTPDGKNTANTPPPAPPTMPVEQLIESLKPEKTLVESGSSATGSTGGSTGLSSPGSPQ